MGKVFGIDIKTGAINRTFTPDGYKSNDDEYFKADDTFRDDLSKFTRNNVDYKCPA